MHTGSAAMCWCPVPDHQPGLRDVILEMSLVRCVQVLMVLLILTSRVRPHVQDQCDATVWDTGIGEMGVRDVTGSCAEGHIDWRNPYGAIRVSLKPSPLPSNYKNVSFEACFLASAHYTTVKFSLDNPSIGLKPLIVLTPDSAQMTSELCFRSEGDPVVLFVESELDSQSAAMGLVQIEYDIKRLPRPDQRQHYDCRPCTDTEILEAVCSSDLVFVGSMDLVTHNPATDQSSLHIKVTKMIRQRNSLFKVPKNSKPRGATRTLPWLPRLKLHTENGVRELFQNEAAPSLTRAESSQSDGVLVAPRMCGIRKGHGDFMFIGRIRFKKGYLHCAPRIDEFTRMWAYAKRTRRNMCSLE